MSEGRMDSSRQEAFKKLREPCVELSSVGLRYRGHQASPNEVLRALRSLHNVLKQIAGHHALDEKLAEYAFFPLAHIFNESKRAPVNVLELAINCLHVLVTEGWRVRLSPQMGKQLVILLTLIVGSAPSNANGNKSVENGSLELRIAGFDCLYAIFDVLSGPVAEKTIYHDIGGATVIDQTVYILLEGISGNQSDELCVSAARALQALYRRITDRVVLASIMPRTVSALTKVLKPTTQVRRSYRLIIICLGLFNGILEAVLNDQANSQLPETSQPQEADEELVLDASWLKATATQIKLALTQVIQLRRHERQEVQEELLSLCIMIVENCRNTLQESLPVLIETILVLSELDEDQSPNNAYSALKHMAITYTEVLDSLKNSVHTWLTAFPRTMQSNDETTKQWAMKQISTAFQVLSEIQSGSDLLINNLTSGLCDSVAVIVNNATGTLQPLNSEPAGNQTLEILNHEKGPATFSSVLLDHKSQQQTLKDLQSMIARLNLSDSASDITRLIVNRIHREQGHSVIAPLWLATLFLKSTSQTSSFDEFISFDHLEPSRPYSTRANMIEELYYISLPILNEPLADESTDWRVLALALEAVALQAQELREAFRPELMDALYPVLQLLASNSQGLQRHAMTCLDILTKTCNYPDTTTMVIENVDYLVNSVALKLNTFDVSIHPPQVLLMMVKLCGARLVPYLDDLVDSIFGILDLYHGYPKLVELMFKTLAAIVEESTRNPSILAIENGDTGRAPDHLKQKYQGLRISTLAEDLAHRKTKRAEDDDLTSDTDEYLSHPKRPWAEDREKKDPEQTPETDTFSELLGKEDSDEPLPPPREPEDAEKPLSKPHSLLLHIVKSLPSHLSSPSPYLRRSLLSILINVLPVLAADENSFLPLINDLWPAIVSRISFPSSFGTGSSASSSSTALLGKDTPSTTQKRQTRDKQAVDEFDFKEETFVTTTACKAVEAIFRSAGDFMASRVEAEFPRWERLYNRAWDKVRQDTDKMIERRTQQQLQLISATSTKLDNNNNSNHLSDKEALEKTPSLTSAFIQPLSLTKAGSASGSRAFTPHHALWRALISLFLSLLSHVRLPLPVGDRICHILGEWVARYAGPMYYFSHRPSQIPSNEEERDSIENVIQAMETWNSDLAWFIFSQLRKETFALAVAKNRKETGPPLKTGSLAGGRLRFAELIF